MPRRLANRRALPYALAPVLATVLATVLAAPGCGGRPHVVEQARAAEAAGDTVVAAALYRSAARDGRLEPADALALHYLLRTEAEGHAAGGWYQQAESLFEEAAQLDVPAELIAETLMRVVDLRGLRGADPGRTAALLDEALHVDPRLDHYAALADLYTRAGDSAAAREALVEAAARAPDDLSLALAVAGAHVGAGDDAQALAAYATVLEADPSHPQALGMMATLHERAGDLTAAEAAWQALVDAWPDVPGGWVRFAAFVERTGDVARAERLRARAAAAAEAP